MDYLFHGLAAAAAPDALSEGFVGIGFFMGFLVVGFDGFGFRGERERGGQPWRWGELDNGDFGEGF